MNSQRDEKIKDFDKFPKTSEGLSEEQLERLEKSRIKDLIFESIPEDLRVLPEEILNSKKEEINKLNIYTSVLDTCPLGSYEDDSDAKDVPKKS